MGHNLLLEEVGAYVLLGEVGGLLSSRGGRGLTYFLGR